VPEFANPQNAVPPEGSTTATPLESLLCTEDLHRRPSRPPDYIKENRAPAALAGELADSPGTMLRT